MKFRFDQIIIIIITIIIIIIIILYNYGQYYFLKKYHKNRSFALYIIIMAFIVRNKIKFLAMQKYSDNN